MVSAAGVSYLAGSVFLSWSSKKGVSCRFFFMTYMAFFGGMEIIHACCFPMTLIMTAGSKNKVHFLLMFHPSAVTI